MSDKLTDEQKRDVLIEAASNARELFEIIPRLAAAENREAKLRDALTVYLAAVDRWLDDNFMPDEPEAARWNAVVPPVMEQVRAAIAQSTDRSALDAALMEFGSDAWDAGYSEGMIGGVARRKDEVRTKDLAALLKEGR